MSSLSVEFNLEIYLMYQFISVILTLVITMSVMAASLEEVTVTASPLKLSIDETAQSVSVLDDAILRAQMARNLASTLESQAGISATDFGPAVSRPIIRGFAGPRVLLLENSMSGMDLSSLSDDHAPAMEADNAVQIEVLRGPMTLLYGSGAIGGVVNVVNARLPNKLPAQFSGELQAWGDTVANGTLLALAVDDAFGNWAVHADAKKQNADDYTIPTDAGITDEDGNVRDVLANSASESQDVAVGTSWFGENSQVGIALNELTQQYGLPNEEDASIDMRQQRVQLKAALYSFDSSIKKIELDVAAARYKHTEFEGEEIGTRFKNDEWQTRVGVTQSINDAMQWIWGTDLKQQDFSALGAEAYIPTTTTQSQALFGIAQYQQNDWRWETGLRVEKANLENTTANEDFDLLNGSLAARWSLTEPLSLSFSLGYAERAPTAEELFACGAHIATSTYTVGLIADACVPTNVDVAPESYTNLDIGLRWQTTQQRLLLTLFTGRSQNYLYLAPTDTDIDGIADRVDDEGVLASDGELLRAQYQQHTATFQGYEIEALWSLSEQLGEGWDLRVFTDRVRGRLTDDRYLPRMTPPRAGVAMLYQVQAWSAVLENMYIARQNELAELETPTQSATVWGAKLAYDIALGEQTLSLYARGENLTDEVVRRHTSWIKAQSPLPGRNWQLGLNWKF
ncbi:MAG: TonB-dependent receptor [Gammaproteobacteria bacterium]|nr:TonB-dependent receptor [Gammaproteobacteria bacterium]